LISKDKLKEIFENIGFIFEAFEFKNGTILYFKATLKE